MLDLNSLEEKKNYYFNLISDLKNRNVSREADERLAEERTRIIEEIQKEIDNDVIKCEHYVELLDNLIESEKNIVTEEIEEIPSVEENDNIEENQEEFVEDRINIEEIQNPFIRPEEV